MSRKMNFLFGIVLFLCALTGAGTAQEFNPKAEILGSSEKIVKGAPFSAEAVSESVQITFDGNRITRSVKSRMYRDSEGRFRRDEMPKPVGMGSFVETPQSIFILDPLAGLKFYLDSNSKTVRQSVIKNSLFDKQNQIEKRKETLAKWQQQLEWRKQEFERLEQEIKNSQTEERKQLLVRRKQEIEDWKRRIESEKQRIESRKQEIESRKGDFKGPQPSNMKQIDKKAEIKGGRFEHEIESSSNSESNSSGSGSSNGENVKPDKAAAKPKPRETAAKADHSKAAGAAVAAGANKPNNPAKAILPGDGARQESLGTRKFEGLEIEGTRFTRTVAAGAIGNERAFDIVYERWYSKELETIVSSSYADPRFGQQTYRLINLKREEPDGSLFTVPADYKAVDKPREKLGHPEKKKIGPPGKKSP